MLRTSVAPRCLDNNIREFCVSIIMHHLESSPRNPGPPALALASPFERIRQMMNFFARHFMFVAVQSLVIVS